MFGEKGSKLVQTFQTIDELEATIVASQSWKRRKVKLSPNSKFALINDMYRVLSHVVERDLLSLDIRFRSCRLEGSGRIVDI